ncbi:CopG family transcriptional regulator [Candidatus Woesearchaeota archaeon]|nr:CopG family transcriptional regulator [Candidatus Woesearchaeota archaeon]
MSESNITTISVPKVLADKIKKRMEGTGFNSVSSYVTYVLRQVLSNAESVEKKTEMKEAFSEEDEKKVKERLRSLGYLD